MSDSKPKEPEVKAEYEQGTKEAQMDEKFQDAEAVYVGAPKGKK